MPCLKILKQSRSKPLALIYKAKELSLYNYISPIFFYSNIRFKRVAQYFNFDISLKIHGIPVFRTKIYSPARHVSIWGDKWIYLTWYCMDRVSSCNIHAVQQDTQSFLMIEFIITYVISTYFGPNRSVLQAVFADFGMWWYAYYLTRPAVTKLYVMNKLNH